MHYSDHLTVEQAFRDSALTGPTCPETRRIAEEVLSLEAPTLSRSKSQVLG